MIWLCFRPDQAVNMHNDIARWKDHLPFERLQKMHSYRMLSDQWLCAAAYRLLQHGLSSEYGIAENGIQVNLAPSGKPFLKDIPNIYFNISHCDMGAVCALSNREIGVDIESFLQPKPQAMKHVMNDNEYDSIISSQCPAKAFTRFWTLKESWLKATGFGLVYGPRQVPINLIPAHPCISQDGFIAKVVWENEKGCIAQCCKDENLLPVIACTM